VGTELILLSIRAFDEFSDGAQVICIKKFEMSDWSAFGLLGKYRMRRFQRYLQKGKHGVEDTQTPCQGSTYAKMGTTQSGRHVGIWGASDEM
jgi:hypothetical protein